jgi:predicted ATP-binding protein involved in virulence
MKITQLSLTDFRGIRNLILDLSDFQVTIFIGANGAGKSSVLDAAAIALTYITAQLGASGAGRRQIQATDIHNKQAGAIVAIHIEHCEQQYRWAFARHGRNAKKQEVSHLTSPLDAVKNLATVLQNNLSSDTKSIPLLAYYPVNRAVLDIPLKIRVTHDFNPLDAFDGALTRAANFRVFFEWFRNREDFENEQRLDTPSFIDTPLEAVRTAIQTFMHGCTNLRVRRNPLRMTINKAGEDVLIDQLSDGEKCLLALVGDLARRLAIANPYSTEPLAGQGIVLIDEIELHLHPAWQRSVVHQLKMTFPNCQFLLSTHSPQVLGDGKDAGIFAITTQSDDANNKENLIAPLGNLYGADSNRILDEIMGAATRTSQVSALFKELFHQIEQKNWQQVQELSAQLTTEIDNDDPDLLKARMLIRLKGGS